MESKEFLAVTILPELKHWLKEQAMREKRTISATLELILIEAQRSAARQNATRIILP
jgi:hypothetical protein